MKPLVIIPARGGSKGVPGKNIKLLNGKPLIQYSIDIARAVMADDLIVVSTDDEKIRDVVEQTGLKVPFLRPLALATDQSASRDVILHAIQFTEGGGYYPDTIILLQPTSPFRQVRHIREALAAYSADVDMVISVKETRSNPYYVLFEESTDGYLERSKAAAFTRRQDCPKVWELNGAIYIINVDSIKAHPLGEFKKIVKYEMDEYSSLDIDTMFDWELAELIVKKSSF